MLRNEKRIQDVHRRQSLEEELEAERAINFFAMSLLEQTTIEEVLWDVAKNCIARLNFVDCVVYWLDTNRNVLVQKAAHGPKNPVDFEIYKPIDIPVGHGIVGSVAQTGQPELIGDTSTDLRYIQDDDMRYSEIAVPILSEGSVLGVIDAEHPEKYFFTPRHLHILTKIAALCAQKIRRVQIEQAYRQTERQLLENNQRIAETKLLALRMQMNPHFVFNSLNSINNFIIQNDAEHASEYLTKFSRLMRQALVNTQSDWVSLRNDLKALQIYLELEQLRCDHRFDFVIQVDSQLNQDMVHIPPLITQPYVENAIRHGLLPQKDRQSTLTINCRADDTGRLVIDIHDNGIGRQESARQQTKSLREHKFEGSRITEERLALINEIHGTDAGIQTTDLYDEAGNATGTCVTFTMKLKHP